MKATGNKVIRFPIRGWCVRSGFSAAHFFDVDSGKSVAICGMVQRDDQYYPQWSKPRQMKKPHCRVCERTIEQAAQRLAHK